MLAGQLTAVVVINSDDLDDYDRTVDSLTTSLADEMLRLGLDTDQGYGLIIEAVDSDEIDRLVDDGPEALFTYLTSDESRLSVRSITLPGTEDDESSHSDEDSNGDGGRGQKGQANSENPT